MITAKELRAGNIVKGCLPDGIEKIPCTFEVTHNMIYEFASEEEDFIIDNGLRLNIGVLEKFGFTRIRDKEGTQGVYTNGTMNLSVSYSGNVYTTSNKCLLYAHKLQNLYFELYDQELSHDIC